MISQKSSSNQKLTLNPIKNGSMIIIKMKNGHIKQSNDLSVRPNLSEKLMKNKMVVNSKVEGAPKVKKNASRTNDENMLGRKLMKPISKDQEIKNELKIEQKHQSNEENHLKENKMKQNVIVNKQNNISEVNEKIDEKQYDFKKKEKRAEKIWQSTPENQKTIKKQQIKENDNKVMEQAGNKQTSKKLKQKQTAQSAKMEKIKKQQCKKQVKEESATQKMPSSDPKVMQSMKLVHKELLGLGLPDNKSFLRHAKPKCQKSTGKCKQQQTEKDIKYDKEAKKIEVKGSQIKMPAQKRVKNDKNMKQKEVGFLAQPNSNQKQSESKRKIIKQEQSEKNEKKERKQAQIVKPNSTQESKRSCEKKQQDKKQICLNESKVNELDERAKQRSRLYRPTESFMAKQINNKSAIHEKQHEKEASKMRKSQVHETHHRRSKAGLVVEQQGSRKE